MGVEPTRNGATIRRVNHFTTATKLFPNLIAWRQIVLYYTTLLSSSVFCKLFNIFFCSALITLNKAVDKALDAKKTIEGVLAVRLDGFLKQMVP